MPKNLPVKIKDCDNSRNRNYAVRSEDVAEKADSGGSFTLARSVLDKGGVVGVVMNGGCFHAFARNEKRTGTYAAFKYVESDLGDTFPRIRELLDEKKKVLFAILPVLAGLKLSQ